MSLIVRLANTDDLAALLDLDIAARTDPAAPAHAAEWLEPGREEKVIAWLSAGECFVAEVSGELAGYAVLHYHFFRDGIIDMLIVARAHRRKGIAEALVRHLEGQCLTDKIWTSTNLSNQPMQALTAKAGYIMSGFIEGLDEGDPELVYRKVLRPAV